MSIGAECLMLFPNSRFITQKITSKSPPFGKGGRGGISDFHCSRVTLHHETLHRKYLLSPGGRGFTLLNLSYLTRLILNLCNRMLNMVTYPSNLTG
jgi:hypothetical protein